MDVIAAVSLGICIYCCIVLALYVKGTNYDTVRRRVFGVTGSARNTLYFDEEMDKPISERFFKPMVRSLAAGLGRMFPALSAQGEGTINKQTEKMKKMLNQAGFSIGVAEYRVLRVFIIFGTGVLFGLIALILRLQMHLTLFAAAFGAFLAYTAIRYILAAIVSGRHREMEQQMPDVLDLLSVSVEAGLGFEQALGYIVSHFEGPLIDEMAVTYREMAMGRTRHEALLLLGERCSIKDMKSFVGAMVQASEWGISIKNVLRAQASAMRQSRRNRVEEKAMKISVKILIPMVVLIFPVMFIILLGPAVVKVLGIMGINL